MERREASGGTLRECRIGISGIFRRLIEVGRGIGDGSDDEDFGNLGETISGNRGGGGNRVGSVEALRGLPGGRWRRGVIRGNSGNSEICRDGSSGGWRRSQMVGFRNWRGKGGEVGAMEKIAMDGTG